jgi:hypothetical protein
VEICGICGNLWKKKFVEICGNLWKKNIFEIFSDVPTQVPPHPLFFFIQHQYLGLRALILGLPAGSV